MDHDLVGDAPKLHSSMADRVLCRFREALFGKCNKVQRVEKVT